jgi:predicted dehydrogenase
LAKRIKAGIVGTGWGAVTLAPALAASPNVELVAVCSARRPRAESAAKRFGAEHAFEDYRDLIAMDDLDLVCVCVPPDLHVEITSAAIDRGHHVLCTKPLADSAMQARHIRDAARSRGVVHAMDLGRRYAPEHRYLRDLVRSGFLGELRFVSSTVFVGLATDPSTNGYYFNWISRRPGGGILHAALMAHYVDLLRFTFGEIYDVGGSRATLIRAKPVLSDKHESPYGLGSWAETEGVGVADAEDAVVIHASFGNGAPLRLAGTWSVYNGTGERLEVYGSDGTLVLERSGRILGAAAKSPALTELPVPERFRLPETGPGPIALYSCLANDVAAVILGTQAEGLFATFDDGVCLLEIEETIHW